MDKRAKIYIRNKDGFTPLELVKKESNLKIFLFNYRNNFCNTLLYDAIRSKKLTLIRYLLNQLQFGINVVNKKYNTPLHVAARYGQLGVVKELLNRDASIDAQNKEGNTPLHVAARYGQLGVVKELLNRDASIDAQNKEGNTPLHVAARYGHLDVVKKLVRRGANIYAQNNNGLIPLELVDKENNWEVGNFFLNLKIDNGYFSRPHQEYEIPTQNSYDDIPLELANGTDYIKGEVTSGAKNPFSLVNSLLSWVKSSIGGLLGSRVELSKETSSAPSPISQVDAKMDVNGTIMLLDVLIRKVTGQKYISTVDQSISPLEAQGYALNIIEKFEKVLNKTAIKSGISLTNLNFDPVVVQSAIIRKIINGRFSEIAKILYSFVKEACPEFKQTDKFLDHLRSQLEGEKETVMLQQKVEKPSKGLDQEVSRKVELSKKPDTFLNGTSVVRGISRAMNCTRHNLI